MELSTEFQNFRKILCVCPCCDRIVRVSDLHLYTKGQVETTWLDQFEHDVRLFKSENEEFEKIEEELREKAREKGRKEADKAIRKTIHDAFRKMKINPFDVKPIFYPVEYVVFNGMTKEETVDKVMFLSRKFCQPNFDTLQQQTEKAIEQRKYSWNLIKLDEEGKMK